MDIEGRIIMDLGIQSGTSKAGNPWKKREMVLETFGQYPRKVKFTIFGDTRVDTINPEIGKDYVLSFDLESREFNGKWYTDVTVFRAQPYTNAGNDTFPSNGGYGTMNNPMGNGSSINEPAPFNPSQPPFGGGYETGSSDSDEDLPF